MMHLEDKTIITVSKNSHRQMDWIARVELRKEPVQRGEIYTKRAISYLNPPGI